MIIKGIIFDCDGVLLDSEDIYLNSLSSYLNNIGIENKREDLIPLLGKPMDDIIKHLNLIFDLENFSKEELITGQRKIFYEKLKKMKLKPFDGLLDFLENCKLNDIKMGVASSSKRSYIEYVLDEIGIKDYFDFIIDGDMVQNGKPAPDIYELAYKKMGIPKKNLLIIEDSENGINSGLSSNIFTIGFKGSKVNQDTSKADLEIESYNDLNIENL